MKELEYLEVINKTLADSTLLGDDCAYLEEFGMYVTQDTLVEDVHFSLCTTTPYELAQKAVNVNLSDLAAACALPVYITVSLSLPKSYDTFFIKEFYRGIDKVVSQNDVKVAGGDLTSSEKVCISVCAFGKKIFDIDVSRHNAKPGDIIVTTGVHGDSAGGLRLLAEGKKTPLSLIRKHLIPDAQLEKSQIIAQKTVEMGVKSFAMMDTSDGLGDAVYKISKCSGVNLDIDFDKVPVSKELKSVFPDKWQELALWGGEDFELLICVPEKVFKELDKSKFFAIGKVKPGNVSQELQEQFEKNCYKHFEEN